MIIKCWSCEKDFEYTDEDIHESPDVIEGQYTVLMAVVCPYCKCSTRW